MSAEAPIWDADRDGPLVCRAVADETHDVRTFVFTAAEERRFAFTAGQFMTFEVPLPGGTQFRCYTIASPPTRPHAIEITVKRHPGGPVSHWLHDNLRPGMSIAATGPMGEFVPGDSVVRKRLLISGGSGITPLASMLRDAADRGRDDDIVFIHAARSPRDVIFREQLDLIARRMPRLRVAHVVERLDGGPGWPGFVGRLDTRLLAMLVPDLEERVVFSCGPAPFMGAVRGLLGAAGFNMARYHEESFAFGEAPPEPPPVAETRGFTITLSKSGKSFVCPPDVFVLAASRAAGLRLPSSCTQGVCGTCKSKITAGSVQMPPNAAIRQRERDQGMALLCCSLPLSDLTIER